MRWWSYVVLDEVFDAATVSGGQLHHVALEPPLGGVVGHGLAGRRRHWLVISTDPWRDASVGHLASHIAEDARDELVVQVVLVAIVPREDGVYALRVLGLAQTP